jgi:programmed cell death protein 5
MDEELESLRKKRLKELQEQAAIQEDLQEDQQKQFEEQKRIVLRSILTNDARQRLGRIKIARPDVAEIIENQLINFAKSGQLKNRIDDKQLRMILKRMIPKKHDIKIKRG